MTDATRLNMQCLNRKPHAAHDWIFYRAEAGLVSGEPKRCLGVSPPMPSGAKRCRNVGELIVGGQVVGYLKCELDAGHEHPVILGWESEAANALPRLSDPIPHRATLEWIDPAAVDWPEANDPDERFDVWIPVDGEDQG